jgi:hypothetical protein
MEDDWASWRPGVAKPYCPPGYELLSATAGALLAEMGVINSWASSPPKATAREWLQKLFADGSILTWIIDPDKGTVSPIRPELWNCTREIATERLARCRIDITDPMGTRQVRWHQRRHATLFCAIANREEAVMGLRLWRQERQAEETGAAGQDLEAEAGETPHIAATNISDDTPQLISWETWLAGAVARDVLVRKAYPDAKSHMGDDAPPKDKCEKELRAARDAAGLVTKRGRRPGSKSYPQKSDA